MLHLRLLGSCLVLTMLGALPAALQEPKPGSAWYEDGNDLGFKVKAPKDWEFVPGSPLDRNLIGKYAAGNGQYINLGREAFVMIQVCLVKFDRRKGSTQKEERQVGDKKIEFEVKGCKDIDDWFSKGLDEGKSWRRVEEKPLKGALEGRVSFYEGLSNRGSVQAEPQPVRAFAAVFALSPEVDVALVGIGPGDKKKWRSFENAYETFAKTLQPLAVQAPAVAAAGTDARSVKRAKLQAEVARNPGWSLHETPNYFILSCYDDKQFIEELKLRLEGIRQVYEKDYPPSLARQIRPRATTGEEGGEGAPQDPDRTVAAPAPVDPLALGRNSVVRVCKDRDQYLQYGAPSSSAGYFSSMEEELVVYDDKEARGRDYTWGVLNHEGFHQYIHSFFGNLSPHSWFNEGTGDYYFGFQFNVKTKKFKSEKSMGRQSDLLSIRDRYVTLKDFVRWTQAQYYGNNPGNGSGEPLEQSYCYAQGWSLVWFLRTGASKAKGWQEKWETILDVYLRTLVETGDLKKALDAAFEGVDWDALETSWRGYMM